MRHDSGDSPCNNIDYACFALDAPTWPAADAPQPRTDVDFARIDFDGQLFLGHYHFAEVKKPLSLHCHEGMMEICYLASGMQVYEVAERRYVMKGNDLFVTFPDEAHGTGAFPQEKGELFWMQVRMPAPNEPFLIFPPTTARPLLDRLLNLPRRHFPGTRRLQRLFAETMLAYRQPEAELARLTVATRVVEYLLLVLACAEAGEAQPPRDDINHVLRYIDDHLDVALPVEMLAEEIRLSPSRFKARFKQEVGMPPAEYVLRRKIERAKVLLTTQSVTDTAFALGFSSSQYFATVFKRFTGLRPREYQRVSP